MTILRQEKQQYADSASLVAETIVPTANDTIYVEDLNREFDWIEGSTATHDGAYVIEQTSQTANGRWIASKFASVYTGTGTSDVIENGQSAIVDITVTGVNPASANMISITNADTFPTNLFVVSKNVVGTDTVRIVLENQSGVQLTAVTVNVTVLEFVKAEVVTSTVPQGVTAYAQEFMIGSDDYNFTGEYTSDGGAPVTATGFIFYSGSNPTSTLATPGVINIAGDVLTSPFTGTVNSPSSSDYWCKAYVTNSVGTTYSAETWVVID